MRHKTLPKKYIYRIILVNHGREVKELGKFKDETETYNTFHEMIEESDKVVFPKKLNNEKSVIVESDYEIAIIKVKGDKESDTSLIQNDTGKFIKYSTDNTSWIIIDRAPYSVEETFFVYGHHPRYDRKEFTWIFENLIKNTNPRHTYKMMALYLNKLLIEDSDTLNIIICKNKKDGIRLYNKIEEQHEAEKLNNTLFIGDIAKSKYKREWIEKIQTTTGWNKTRIKRPSTRP